MEEQPSEPAHTTDLHIVSVESAFPHDQQVSLRVRRAESLLTEGQEGPGVGQVEQCRDSVRHTIWLLVEKHRPRREVGRPHALWCVKYFLVYLQILCREES